MKNLFKGLILISLLATVSACGGAKEPVESEPSEAPIESSEVTPESSEAPAESSVQVPASSIDDNS